MRVLFRYIICGLFLLLPTTAQAQTDPQFYDYPKNHLPWFTLESDHFLIHFQEGNSRSAQVVTRIAEETYEPITELYDHLPDEKVSIVLWDRDDYSNGAAYFFDNKIDIWLPSLNSPLRGTHDWLRNVITHEFTHIIQIQKGMKRSRRLPAVYLQWLSYEEVRRPDVLYGFPNGLVTMPFASVSIPAWFAEGTAQYQRVGLSYDTWDSYRDMLLRTRILNDTYLSLEEMGTFSSKTSLERELVYNQGYAFVIYLVNEYGEQVLTKITESLSEKGLHDVSTAIKEATGISGDQVFENWINDRKAYYRDATLSIQASASESVEQDGFFNFYPRVSPDGETVAYLSNKGRDYSQLSLYLSDKEKEHTIAVTSPEAPYGHHSEAGDAPVKFISSAYSFSPDGNEIAYAVHKKTPFGESYQDVFIFDRSERKSRRLTTSSRIMSPSWEPKGEELAAIQYAQGSQNLILLDTGTGSIKELTSFRNGETLFNPVWSADGKSVYFGFMDNGLRSIRRYHLSSGEMEEVLKDPAIEFRDPYISDDGYLYYASDPDGIFNIYRQPLDGGEIEKVTSVYGGAFMPFVTPEGDLYYAEFEDQGYRIRKTELTTLNRESLGYYEPVLEANSQNINVDPYILQLNDFDDSDIHAFEEEILAVADTGSYGFTQATQNGSQEIIYREYTDTFTKFSFFPIVRFDNYTKLNGNNGTLIKNGKVGKLGENLLRDVKPGLYFGSRDVIDRWSIFGGILLGVGSRPAEDVGAFISPGNIIDMDRDLFLIAEHRGLPFIKKSWSPTVSVELYNLHRNVRDGLEVEEFACTSCAVPDTVNVDIAYEVWEANLFLRSKLSRRSLLELGIGYSPYQVQVDNFYSRELQTLIPSSSSEYFRGTRLSASYTFDYYEYARNADIAPIGLKGYLRYQYEPSKLLEEYELSDGSLQPVYKSTRNHSAELHLRYGYRLRDNRAIQLRVRGFNYFNETGDSFYSDYIGGFLGMRSFPYFALAGERTAFSTISWFMPLKTNMHHQSGPYTFDKIYTRLFFETGNAWSSPYSTGNNLKYGLGAELRMSVNRQYLFPLKFFVSAAYGLDRFQLTLPSEFLTGSQSNTVTYGRELLFHFGLSFDFELL